MKTKITLVLALCCFFMISTIQAQDVQKVFTELTSNLKDEAFKGSWKKNKDAWMSKLGDLDIAEMKGTGDEMLALVNNLKGSAFEKGVKKDLISKLSSPKNAAQLANIMDTLVRGIKPSMFKDGFSPNGILQEIDKFM